MLDRSINMSTALPPPDSPDSSSLPSSYRPFSNLPFELAQAIIESTAPHHYNSTTYEERQSILRSLCGVSRLFREVAQPLLFAVARYTNRLDRAAWDQRYCRDCDEAFPAEDLVFLRFDFVVPALAALSVEYSGIRSLTIWEFKGSLDLADLSPLSSKLFFSSRPAAGRTHSFSKPSQTYGPYDSRRSQCRNLVASLYPNSQRCSSCG